MKTVLNIRGAHCSGKTTAVRMFLSKHPNSVEEFAVGKYKTAITVLKDANIVVLGRYDQGVCGGCDRYKGGEHVKQTIVKVAERYNPDVIIYEGIMYSITYKMADEIANLCERIGYQWKSVYLFREYDNMVELLESRNNGKTVNMMAVNTKYERAMAVYRKLAESGRNIHMVDVTRQPIERLQEIVENEVKG